MSGRARRLVGEGEVEEIEPRGARVSCLLHRIARAGLERAEVVPVPVPVAGGWVRVSESKGLQSAGIRNVHAAGPWPTWPSGRMPTEPLPQCALRCRGLCRDTMRKLSFGLSSNKEKEIALRRREKKQPSIFDLAVVVTLRVLTLSAVKKNGCLGHPSSSSCSCNCCSG
jgi:hypothetical protein